MLCMSQPKDITAARLWTVFAKAHRSVSAHVEESIARHGLCLSDFMALEALLHKGPLTIGEIGARVLLTSGSMTAAVDRLEKRALVRREFTETDRRARVIHLTPKGLRCALTGSRSTDGDFGQHRAERALQLIEKAGAVGRRSAAEGVTATRNAKVYTAKQ